MIYINSNINFVNSFSDVNNSFTIHPKHLKILKENSLNFNSLYSYINWILFSLYSLLISQIFFLKIIFLFFFDKRKIDHDSAFFYSFPLNKFKKNKNESEFFLKHFIKKFKINKIYHDNNDLVNETKYCSIQIKQNVNNIRVYSFLNFIKFILFNFFFLFLSIVLFIFKQDIAIMMKEILKAYLFHIENKNYSKIYFFNNSDAIYRPMWSYIKKKESKCYFFFTGGNCMPFEDKNISDVDKFKLYFSSSYYGLEYWSWENYLFWNEFQKNSYLNKLTNKDISYETDRYVEINDKIFFRTEKKKTLSIFDISPYDKIFTVKRFASIYHNFKNVNIMFKDILDICEKLDINIIYKSKKYKKNIHDFKYKNFLEKINNLKNVSVCDEEYSSSSILRESDMAICSPFTSVGMIAKILKVNCVYYDLSGINYKQMIAFGDLPIINNKKDLENWIKKHNLNEE